MVFLFNASRHGGSTLGFSSSNEYSKLPSREGAVTTPHFTKKESRAVESRRRELPLNQQEGSDQGS